MRYVIRKQCHIKIEEFYRNVAKKYRYTYSRQLMQKNVLDATKALYQIEQTLIRRKPTLSRRQKQGWHMANTDKWYYAYTIDGDTITIQDACHAQNMHDGIASSAKSC